MFTYMEKEGIFGYSVDNNPEHNVPTEKLR